MGPSLEVVASELNTASARLQDSSQQLQDGLSGVDLEVRQLLGSGWTGEAASAFAPEWEKWHDGAGQVVRVLQVMSDLLRAAGRQYASTDQQSAHALGSSMSGADESTRGSDGLAGPSDQGARTGMTGQPSTPRAAAPPMDLEPLTSGLTQAGQVVTGLAQQTGQAVAGLVAQAAHVAEYVVEQVGQDPPDDDERPTNA